MPQFDDDLMIGPVVAGGGYSVGGLKAANRAGGSSPMTRGIGPLGRLFVYDIVPLALGAANIAALQTTAGAANLVLTAGTGVTSVIINGQTRLQFDVPRGVSITSISDLTGVNFTISGYDVYGQPMTQTLAGGNTATVTTKKAFYQIVSIAASGAIAANVSVGTSDLLGMPLVVPDLAFITRIGYNNTLLQNAATCLKADATSPATASTGDVRGTVLPTSATDGVKQLVVVLALPGAAVGPQATRLGALGVTQV